MNKMAKSMISICVTTPNRAKKVLRIDDCLTPMTFRHIREKTITIARPVPHAGSLSGSQKYPR